MTAFWDYKFIDSVEFTSTYDEMPLWSASFGQLMLKHLELKHNVTVLDLGHGTGFPLIELAERLGPSSVCYGLDPWRNANQIARKKILNYGITNVQIVEGNAAKIPFKKNSFDLIVSNLGVNNFDKPGKVFLECSRVLKASGKMAITTNLNGHWIEFYDIFESMLREMKEENILQQIMDQQEKRGNLKSISNLFENAELTINKSIEDSFEMIFLDGTAFLNHHFVKLGWLSSWQQIIPREKRALIFSMLENNLNNYAKENKGLRLTVPMAYIEAGKA